MNIKNLKMNSKIRKILLNDKELLVLLQRDKQKFPFPPNFIPEIIEIRLDNILVAILNTEKNIEWNSKINETINKKPEIIDWRFDGECGLFIIAQNIIINRVEQLNIFSDEFKSTLVKS